MGNNFPGISWNIVVIIIKYLVNTREGFPPFLWLVEKKNNFPLKIIYAISWSFFVDCVLT